LSSDKNLRIELNFLSSRGGKSLVIRTVNNMIEQVIQRHPEFKGHLTVHVLRHTYNDMLSERAKALGLSGADEKQVRNYLNDWNPQSNQGDEYRNVTFESGRLRSRWPTSRRSDRSGAHFKKYA
jgi:integrase